MVTLRPMTKAEYDTVEAHLLEGHIAERIREGA